MCLRVSGAAPEFIGWRYRLRRARRADEFLLLLAAAPEYSGVLTATVFLSSSEEVLDSGLPLAIVGCSPLVLLWH